MILLSIIISFNFIHFGIIEWWPMFALCFVTYWMNIVSNIVTNILYMYYLDVRAEFTTSLATLFTVSLFKIFLVQHNNNIIGLTLFWFHGRRWSESPLRKKAILMHKWKELCVIILFLITFFCWHNLREEYYYIV